MAQNHLETLCEQSQAKEEEIQEIFTQFFAWGVSSLMTQRKLILLAVLSEDQVRFLYETEK